ncbi:hypothetical protein JB92DRAFT_3097931 [Gautieria morchelliformis]|nr:hypothetical protein JB92DRAFT_3097931 [Gautieria morchelliformis]
MLLAALGQTPLLNGVGARREKQFVDSNLKRILVSTDEGKKQEGTYDVARNPKPRTRGRHAQGRIHREILGALANYPPFRAPTLALSTLVVTSVGGCPAQRKKTCGIYLANEMKPKVIRIGMVNRRMREWVGSNRYDMKYGDKYRYDTNPAPGEAERI